MTPNPIFQKIQRLCALLGITLCFVFTGCGAKTVRLTDEFKVTKDNVSMWATWVKDKGKKYDLNLNIANNTDKDVIIMLEEMSCFRGSNRGALKHTFFNTGERVIDFRAGQMKGFNLVCDLQANVEGDFKIKVAKVYENLGGDGKTRGKAIASDLEWKINIVK